MIKVVLSCFLSFSIPGVTVLDASIMSLAYDNYDPINNISFEAKDAGYEQVGFIGQHTMVQVKDIEALGYEVVDILSMPVITTGVTNFHYSYSTKLITTNTVSLTSTVSELVETGLNSILSGCGVSISVGSSVKQSYIIEETETYTTSTEREVLVKFDVREEFQTPGHSLGLCVVADVFKVTYETWKYDDWWWGDLEVDNSRKKQTAYLTYAPMITILYDEKPVLKDMVEIK